MTRYLCATLLFASCASAPETVTDDARLAGLFRLVPYSDDGKTVKVGVEGYPGASRFYDAAAPSGPRAQTVPVTCPLGKAGGCSYAPPCSRADPSDCAPLVHVPAGSSIYTITQPLGVSPQAVR